MKQVKFRIESDKRKDSKYKVSGIFTLEIESENYQEAKSKAKRILHDSGISGHVMEINKIEEDKHE
jgi:hypothetical protein